jgi:hypothetical protein
MVADFIVVTAAGLVDVSEVSVRITSRPSRIAADPIIRALGGIHRTDQDFLEAMFQWTACRPVEQAKESSWEAFVVIPAIDQDRRPDLPKIIAASRLFGLASDQRDRRNQQSGQDGDNRDNDQQFDEGETAFVLHGAPLKYTPLPGKCLW